MSSRLALTKLRPAPSEAPRPAPPPLVLRGMSPGTGELRDRSDALGVGPQAVALMLRREVTAPVPEVGIEQSSPLTKRGPTSV